MPVWNPRQPDTTRTEELRHRIETAEQERDRKRAELEQKDADLLSLRAELEQAHANAGLAEAIATTAATHRLPVVDFTTALTKWLNEGGAQTVEEFLSRGGRGGPDGE